MRSDLHFDQFVREQLSGATAEVPSHILENVLAARRNSRPKGFWLTFLNSSVAVWIGVIMLLTGGGLYLYSRSDSKPSEESITPSNTVSSSSSQKSIVDPDISGEQNSDRSSQQKISQPDATTDNNNTPDNPGSDLSTLSNQQNNRVQSKRITSVSTTGQIPEELNPGANNVNNTSDNSTVITNKVLFPLLNSNARTITANKTTPRMKMPDCPTIESNAAGNKKYWEVYAGPDHVFGNFKTFGDTASYNYLQKRKAIYSP